MICLECNKEVKSIGYKHLKSCSDITTLEYKKRHPGASLMDDNIKSKCVHFIDKNNSYNPEIHKQNSWKRICKCGNVVNHKSYESYLKSVRANTHCIQCNNSQVWLNKNHSEESKNKISKSNLGKHYNSSRLGFKESEESIEKRSLKLKGRVPGFINKSHSRETKLKMRLKRIEDMDKKYTLGWTSPNYNKKACKLFEEINKEMSWNGQHAEHVGEFKILGYFLDFYEPTLNIAIEFDEKRHENPKQKKRDMEKQQIITEALGCKFYRIKQGKEKEWKNIIL